MQDIFYKQKLHIFGYFIDDGYNLLMIYYRVMDCGEIGPAQVNNDDTMTMNTEDDPEKNDATDSSEKNGKDHSEASEDTEMDCIIIDSEESFNLLESCSSPKTSEVQVKNEFGKEQKLVFYKSSLTFIRLFILCYHQIKSLVHFE